MAFAADPTMGGLNKAAALKGNLGWKSKEDGSVSNSSNGSTTTGRESGCDDEATKTNRDGSGSSSGSGSTAKAYKESAQDESCSSGSRSEQAQDVQDSEPKQQNSLKTAGPMESLGSSGHPDNCKPCAFYCFSLCGCRMDRDCNFCHLFHQSRLKQRREEWKRNQRMRRHKARPKTSSEATESATAVVQQPGAVPGTGAVQAPAPVPTWSGAPAPKSYPATSHIEEGALLPTGEALESLIQQVSMNTALLRSLLPMLSNVSARTSLMGPQADLLTALVYASSTLPPPMPQQDSFAAALTTQGDMEFFEYVPNSLEVFVGQMVELWPPVNQMRGCVYAVAPQLPRGVALDERSGLLHGRPQERTPGQMTYFITAWSPTRTPPVVSVALVKLMVNHAFDARMR
mmetsp:Transcript_671/g.1465  ORF Transcript_671/g.1465 Transcript_671/m.1465 type:complete len:401 (+) Transcript_671:92-1294(+)